MPDYLKEVVTDDTLHRAVPINPNNFNEKTQEVTSALFKDSKGVSVDRAENRSDELIKESFTRRFENLRGEARIDSGFCRDNECRVIDDADEINPYHALILGKDKIELTQGQARRLSRKCKFIPY
jgi:hypothetical protein